MLDVELCILDYSVLESERSQYRIGCRHVCRVVDELTEDADAAVADGVFSVMDKTTTPPSGDKHDYLHPGPYYWPNPNTENGYPYLYRDGQRSPATVLYAPESSAYDRTRLQKLFDNTLVLTLAAFFTGNDEYTRHAVSLVRTWFIDDATRMNPNLTFAQFVPGSGSKRGGHSGVIETKDLYFLLDAVRLLDANGAWANADLVALRQWFTEFLRWLQSSRQGRLESWAPNNHGTYYDLQAASIALFIKERSLAERIVKRARRRIFWQLDSRGAQRFEMRRSITFHYCCFNLQGLVHVARLGDTLGIDLWNHSFMGRSIRRALEWLLVYRGTDWPHRQIEPYDPERLLPLLFAARKRFPDIGPAYASKDLYALKRVFHPHDGIRPYWLLGF